MPKRPEHAIGAEVRVTDEDHPRKGETAFVKGYAKDEFDEGAVLLQLESVDGKHQYNAGEDQVEPAAELGRARSEARRLRSARPDREADELTPGDAGLVPESPPDEDPGEDVDRGGFNDPDSSAPATQAKTQKEGTADASGTKTPHGNPRPAARPTSDKPGSDRPTGRKGGSH